MKSAYQIIRRPVITEKGLAIKENQNTLGFQVASKATKTENPDVALSHDAVERRHYEHASVQETSRTETAHRRAAQLRRHHQLASRRRTQAETAHRRFQARQSWDSSDSGHDRVRSKSLGAHCVAGVRRRREALHPSARWTEGRTKS